MDEEMLARMKAMRQQLGDDVDEIVRWQMTGMLMRKAPVAKRVVYPKCSKCHRDWHGLPQDKCSGSFDDGGHANATLQ